MGFHDLVVNAVFIFIILFTVSGSGLVRSLAANYMADLLSQTCMYTEYVFCFVFSVASGTTMMLTSHFPNSLCWGATNGEFNVSLRVSHLLLEQLLSTNMHGFVI